MRLSLALHLAAAPFLVLAFVAVSVPALVVAVVLLFAAYVVGRLLPLAPRPVRAQHQPQQRFVGHVDVESEVA